MSLCRQGVPIRIEIGPKDVAKAQAVLVRRDTGEKYIVPLADIGVAVPNLLNLIQTDMLARARKIRDERVAVITEYVFPSTILVHAHSSFRRHHVVCVQLIAGQPVSCCRSLCVCVQRLFVSANMRVVLLSLLLLLFQNGIVVFLQVE